MGARGLKPDGLLTAMNMGKQRSMDKKIFCDTLQLLQLDILSCFFYLLSFYFSLWEEVAKGIQRNGERSRIGVHDVKFTKHE